MPRTQSLSFAIRTRTSPLSRRPCHASPSSSHPHHQHQYPSHLPTTSKHLTRTFTQRSSLRILTRPLSRPQLPFLHPSSRFPSKTQRGLLARYMTTERKQRWRQTLRWQLRFHGYLWPSLFLVGLVITGLHQLSIERVYATPREWGFWARWYLRSGRAEEERGVVDWGKVGRWYLDVVRRLEGDRGVGKGDEVLVDVEGGMGLGWDVEGKSEEWKMGYHQALMGCARCAENLDGMAKRKGEEFGKVVPWDSVVGERNPRPKPLPWDKKGGHLNPPREEEMEDAFPRPEVFYMRVLTTTGFSTRQRLDAAIAYADWCDFKGLWDTGSAMYDWALDIAAGALPMGADGVVDIRTGVINQGKEEFVSENLLRATTALGVHCARKGDVKAALPVFLSVLRARRGLPAASIEVEKALKRQRDAARQEESLFMSYFVALKDLIIERPYPLPLSDGNERAHHSLKEACEEVGLMTYIGEILFATSEKEKEKGLSWTRDSVGAAEAVLWVMDERGEEDTDSKDRCRECLETGLDNWKKMAQQMVKIAKTRAVEAKESRGWLGLGIGKGAAIDKANEDVSRWEEEETQIELRRLKTASLIHPLKQLTNNLPSRS